MNTIAQILEKAGELQAGFHIHIDNPPWVALDIEDLCMCGPNGYPTISVAHYSSQNGQVMRDPQIFYEWRRDGGQCHLAPYYWRNDYLGIEQYSSFRDDEQKLFTLAGLQKIQEQFSQIWDRSLDEEGYRGAFEREWKGNSVRGTAA